MHQKNIGGASIDLSRIQALWSILYYTIVGAVLRILTRSRVVRNVLQTSTNVRWNRVETVVAALTRSTASPAHVLWDTREPTAELVRSIFVNLNHIN